MRLGDRVKAISAHYGGVTHTHRAIVAVIDRLVQPAEASGDAETRRRISISFTVARSLHANFYENEMPETIVRDSLEVCEELSMRLYQLFWADGMPPDS